LENVCHTWFLKSDLDRHNDWHASLALVHLNHNQPTNHFTAIINTGQPALAGTLSKNWRILLVQSFTAHMPLLTAACAFNQGEDVGVFNSVT